MKSLGTSYLIEILSMLIYFPPLLNLVPKNLLEVVQTEAKSSKYEDVQKQEEILVNAGLEEFLIVANEDGGAFPRSNFGVVRILTNRSILKQRAKIKMWTFMI